MNEVERIIEALNPGASVRLRLLKRRLQRDPLLAILARFVHAGDTVLDIGANRGEYSLRLAQLVGPRGQVHVFEPNPAGWTFLWSIQHGRRNVTIHRLALSDQTGQAALHVPVLAGQRIDGLASLASPDITHEKVMVRIERLDAALPNGGAAVSFLKCDVEGHEHEVLVGAESVLLRWKPTLLIEIEQRHRQRELRETFSYLADLGYVGYFLEGTHLRPLESFDVVYHQLRFVPPGFVPYFWPPGYVSDFVFVAPGTPGLSIFGERRG